MDAVRYNLLRNLSFASDGDFSRSSFIRHYNDELANDLGNLLNRVVSMIQRYRGGIVPTAGENSERETGLQQVASDTLQGTKLALERWEVGNALSSIWNFVRYTNRYIEQSEPWRLARQAGQESRLDTVLYNAAEATRLLAIYLAPFLPTASNRIVEQLGTQPIGKGAWLKQGTWGSGVFTHVTLGTVLFPRIDTV